MLSPQLAGILLHACATMIGAAQLLIRKQAAYGSKCSGGCRMHMHGSCPSLLHLSVQPSLADVSHSMVTSVRLIFKGVVLRPPCECAYSLTDSCCLL